MNATFKFKGSYNEAQVVEEIMDGMVNADITADTFHVTVIVNAQNKELAKAILTDAGFIK